MTQLLIVAHTPSPNTQAMVAALKAGAESSEAGSVHVDCLSPFDVYAETVQSSSGIILFTTENFGYMAGALKDFFERIYYPCLDETQGLPYCLVVKGGLDGTGARRSVESIVGGLKWRAVQPAMVLTGQYNPEWLSEVQALGMGMAAGLDAGVF